MSTLNGDTPCNECQTDQNIVWRPICGWIDRGVCAFANDTSEEEL